jgi:diguanylate cyclase (GGDEF)-like protein
MPMLEMLVGFAMLLALGLCGTFVIKFKSGNLRGMKELRWAIAAGLLALVCMVFRNLLPAIAVAEFSQTALFFAFVLMYVALARALGRRPRVLPLLAVLLPLYMAGIGYFTAIRNNLDGRLEVASIGVAIVLAWTVNLVAQPVPSGLVVPARWLYRLLVLLVLLRLARVIITLAFDPIVTLKTLDPLQSLLAYLVLLGGIAQAAGTFWISVVAQQEDDRVRADTDGLTGLLNRRAFEELLHSRLGKSTPQIKEISLLLIDLDFFKSMNDDFGHLAGDTVLRRVSGVLRRTVRSVDALARFGGDEFAVLLCSDEQGQGMVVAERVRQNLIQMQNLPGGRKVTASLGVAVALPGDTPMLLLERADRALYRSKDLGRNRLTRFSGDDSDERSDTLPTVLIH